MILSDDSESELLSELAEDAELFELAELSDLCSCCVGFATVKKYMLMTISQIFR